MSASTASPISFTINHTAPKATRFAPRLGKLTFQRQKGQRLDLQTPGMLAMTSRGVVPHLSRDYYAQCERTLRWTNVVFESFLEQNPPVPTLQKGEHPLHTFLGFNPNTTVLSMTARDPHDAREMPTNGNAHVCAHTLRGVRKLSPEDWRSYAHSTKPDVLIALSDTPFTDPPYSQKRLTKSIERSAAWLLNILRPFSSSLPSPSATPDPKPFALFVPLAGTSSTGARRAFSESLREPLYGPEADALKGTGYTCLDDGIDGYTVDMVPLRASLPAPSNGDLKQEETIKELVQTSLKPLPSSKPLLITGASTPHEILRLVSDGGDVFDSKWAQRCADLGVTLDFEFPVRNESTDGKKQLGHNIYSTDYTHDFSPLSSSFAPASSPSDTVPTCFCPTCSPVKPTSRLYHGVDRPQDSLVEDSGRGEHEKPYTRAYIHHLLHTHEMGAHALLAMHNLAVLEAFFEGVRSVLASSPSTFEDEVARFAETYDEEFGVLKEAGDMWLGVEKARGKGRLAREKEAAGGDDE
ncbi:hypothetical protein D9611_014110 [Ephemerocybe angulata]|uniref:tRNA-guanine(15) transglycosylase-like domain-containing protein n=1 Tax=Ephemerocybe angulata TaxID=980116 RepID=A0A8H5B9F5_9AGAR|nr:hypothetical protein D9611_014110 [Tulosesus angulatus]